MGVSRFLDKVKTCIRSVPRRPLLKSLVSYSLKTLSRYATCDAEAEGKAPIQCIHYPQFGEKPNGGATEMCRTSFPSLARWKVSDENHELNKR